VENRTELAQIVFTLALLDKKGTKKAINMLQTALKQGCNNFFGSSPAQTKGLSS